MFSTYEEALEMRLICAICERPKQTVVGVHQHQEKPSYRLERCGNPNCAIHCPGHELEVQDIVHETWREPIKLS